MSPPTREELLADRTAWTLADIARALDMSPSFVAQYAFRAYSEPGTERAFPSPMPGAPRLDLVRLHGVARGRYGPDAGPWWAAGDIRQWGLRTARLDHDLKLIPRRPPTRRRA